MRRARKEFERFAHSECRPNKKSHDEGGNDAHAIQGAAQLSCAIHLRVSGGFIGLARVMRVLSRFRISQADVALIDAGGREFATVLGTFG